MVATRHSIFREKALKHYNQGRKKDVLPNFSSIPTAIFAWALLGALIGTGLLACLGQVPIYLAGSGIVLGSTNHTAGRSGNLEALAFFPPAELTQLHAGQSVQLQPGASGVHQAGTIAQVLPGVTSLSTAFEHYGLNLSSASLESQKVAAALIQFTAGSSATFYAGSTLVLQVNVGTQSLFSALAGIGHS